MPEKNIDEILAAAMEREQEAHDFYMQLAGRSRRPGMREVFEQFAAEELAHKAKLQRVREGAVGLTQRGKVEDLGIAEHLAPLAPQADLDYGQALALAMQREEASFRLYALLADQAQEEAARQLFEGLAQEEARHKLRFEIEYDEIILAEN